MSPPPMTKSLKKLSCSDRLMMVKVCFYLPFLVLDSAGQLQPHTQALPMAAFQHLAQDLEYRIRENFRLTKILPTPDTLCIAEIFVGIKFRQCHKGYHILYVIINTGQKICVIKISSMRADGEIGKNFLLAKISMHTVYWNTGVLYFDISWDIRSYCQWSRSIQCQCHIWMFYIVTIKAQCLVQFKLLQRIQVHVAKNVIH